MVSANAKFSSVVKEILRTAREQQLRVAALINNLNEPAAERKIVSVLFLSSGSATRKSVTDKFPDMRVATISLQEMKHNCEQQNVKPKNRTLERLEFFSRKQTSKETLRQLWHFLTGMASKCAFGEQTESLILDPFIQILNNKMVQQKRRTEPKEDPQEAVRFQLRTKRQLASIKHLKAEEKRSKANYCMRYRKEKIHVPGADWNFLRNHLTVFKAKNEKKTISRENFKCGESI